MKIKWWGLLLGMILILNPLLVYADTLSDVRIQQNLNKALPLKTLFYDESGKQVMLDKYFHDKPVLLTFVYYHCPMLCSLNLKSLAHVLKGIDLSPQKDYELLVVSFDPKDIAENSQAQLDKFRLLLGRPKTQGIHFLTGPENSIKKITKAAGFQYVHDEETGQYAHTTALIAVTPQGVISRYFFGLDYSERDIKLALNESQSNHIGSLTRQILLYCFLYHPQTGRYTLAVLNLLKVAGFLTIVVLLGLVYLLKRQEKRA